MLFFLPTLAFAALPPKPALNTLPPPLPPALVSSPVDSEYHFSRGIPLPEWAHQVIEDDLKANYVFSTEFLKVEDKVALRLRGLKKPKIQSILSDVLASKGFVLSVKDSIYHVTPKAVAIEEKKEKVLSFYRFKNQQPDKLQLVTQFFKDVEFSFPASGSKDATSLPVVYLRGEQSEVDKAKAFFKDLDSPSPVVEVRAVLYEVGLSKTDRSAVNIALNLLNDKVSIGFGSSSTYPDQLRFKTQAVDLVFSSLTGDGRFKSLASPFLMLADGQTGLLNDGGSVPTLAGFKPNTDGTATQEVEYRAFGSQFTITPHVLDDSIALDISYSLSDAVSTESGVNNSPTFFTREYKNKVIVDGIGGEFYILGGSQTYKSSQSNEKFLGLFNMSSDDTEKETQLLLVVYVMRHDKLQKM
jgi:type II secretory pathway component GspD/PulD (secretin)